MMRILLLQGTGAATIFDNWQAAVLYVNTVRVYDCPVLLLLLTVLAFSNLLFGKDFPNQQVEGLVVVVLAPNCHKVAAVQSRDERVFLVLFFLQGALTEQAVAIKVMVIVVTLVYILILILILVLVLVLVFLALVTAGAALLLLLLLLLIALNLLLLLLILALLEG